MSVPYRVSKATIEIDDKKYPIVNICTDEMQQRLIGARLCDTFDIGGIGRLEIMNIYCDMDIETIKRFNGELDFRHYIFECERMDLNGEQGEVS